MKKKIKYYSIAAICSLVWDGMMVCACYQELSNHPIVVCFTALMSVLLNYVFFLQAKEELKPKNTCFVMKLPGVVENDEFEFQRLDLETGRLK